MCNFKKHPDEEMIDEDEVLDLIQLDEVEVVSDGAADLSTDVEEPDEPEAGSSSVTPPHPGFRGDSDNDVDDDDSDYVNDSSEADSDNELDLDTIMLTSSEQSLPAPPSIEFKHHVTDLSFHPQEQLVAISSVTGNVFLYNYDLESCTLSGKLEVHTKSCRALEFWGEGTYLLSCGKDKSLVVTDAATGKFLRCYDQAHEDAPYSIETVDDNVFISGDEGGELKFWDIRQRDSICRFKTGDELIASIKCGPDNKYVVCTTGDGITAYDYPSRKFFVQSESYDTEFTSMQLMKFGKKLVVGTIKGSLYIFDWGSFGYHSDVFPGRKNNINTTTHCTDNVFLCGYGDGSIGATHIFPHSSVGSVGHHKLSVEALDVSCDGKYLGSVGMDETVKFWDLSFVSRIHLKASKLNNRRPTRNLPSSNIRNPEDFFAGLGNS